MNIFNRLHLFISVIISSVVNQRFRQFVTSGRISQNCL